MICGTAVELGNSKKSKLLVGFVLVAHLLCTGTSLLNNSGNIIYYENTYRNLAIKLFLIRLLFNEILKHLINTKIFLGTIWPAMTITWFSVFSSGLLAFRESGFKVSLR